MSLDEKCNHKSYSYYCLETFLFKVFHADSRKAYHICFFLLIAEICITIMMLLFTGCSHQWNSSWDSIIFLDGGWRLIMDQKPYVDFISSMGLTNHLIIMIGMLITGCSGKSLIYGPVIIFPFVMSIGWILSKRRLSALNAFLLSSMVGQLIVAAYSLGLDLKSIKTASYAMQYNRFDWSLICLLFIQLFIPPRMKLTRHESFFESILFGLFLTFILFTKINYIVVSLMTLAVYIIFIKEKFLSLSVSLTVFITSFIIVLLYLEFDIFAIFRNWQMVMGSQKINSMLFSKIFRLTMDNLKSLFLLCIIIFFQLKPILKNSERLGHEVFQSFIIPIFITFMGILICSGNMQFFQIPLFAISGQMLCENLRRKFINATIAHNEFNGIDIRQLICNLISAYFIIVILLPDVSSVSYSLGWHLLKGKNMPQTAFIKSRFMKDVIFPPEVFELTDEKTILEKIVREKPDFNSMTSLEFATWVNDGILLLKPHVKRDSKILCMDYLNPFPYVLELESPTGDMISWTYGQFFDGKNHPRPDVLFHDITLLMIPKISLMPLTVEKKIELYRNKIRDKFVKIDESTLWYLFVRKN
jgi:hypothetical protein